MFTILQQKLSFVQLQTNERMVEREKKSHQSDLDVNSDTTDTYCRDRHIVYSSPHKYPRVLNAVGVAERIVS